MTHSHFPEKEKGQQYSFWRRHQLQEKLCCTTAGTAFFAWYWGA
ncbi:hypothetical protein LEMLEM_LOCUS314 [Lemmus lemmus]